VKSSALAPVPALALIALLFAGVASASAQVAPDSSWMPALSDPQYPEGEGPVVAIDAAHRNRHTRDGGFAPFARLLEEDGYRVRASAEPFTAEALDGIDVLVVANAIMGSWSRPIEPAFTPAEVAAIAAWVEGGGSLLLIADHMPYAGAAAPLAAAFGVEFLDGFAMDSARVGPAVFARARGELADHEAAQGRSAASRVDSVATFTGQAIRAPGATPLLLLPPGYVVLLPEVAWEFDESTPQVPGEGLFQGAVLERGAGRVAVFGEAAMFTAQVAGPARAPAGMNHPAAGGNVRFARNVLAWLVGAAGAPSAGGAADRAAILALHERTRRAHFQRDAEAFLDGTADTWLRISGGELAERRKAERLPLLQDYLDRMEFEAVEDAQPTVVEISADGTLAWLAGVVDIRGRYRGEDGEVEPVSFRAAFLHVYRKGPDGWERVAEADTERPLD
jgi:hypothetical protein